MKRAESRRQLPDRRPCLRRVVTEERIDGTRPGPGIGHYHHRWSVPAASMRTPGNSAATAPSVSPMNRPPSARGQRARTDPVNGRSSPPLFFRRAIDRYSYMSRVKAHATQPSPVHAED
jgi:hypothetical protein